MLNSHVGRPPPAGGGVVQEGKIVKQKFNKSENFEKFCGGMSIGQKAPIFIVADRRSKPSAVYLVVMKKMLWKGESSNFLVSKNQKNICYKMIYHPKIFKFSYLDLGIIKIFIKNTYRSIKRHYFSMIFSTIFWDKKIFRK